MTRVLARHGLGIGMILPFCHICAVHLFHIQQERSGDSARGAAGQRQTFADGDRVEARDQDIVGRNFYVGGNAGRERNFHQIESVELARQRHGHMARRVRMAGQRDFHFAALQCVGVLGKLLDDFRGQVGALEEGQG